MRAGSLNILAGIWLIIAPFVLGYSNVVQAQWNDIVLGAVIAALAALGALIKSTVIWTSWIIVALGFWLIVAPFILSYPLAISRWNDIVLGLVVIVIGTWSATAEEEKK